VLVACGQVEGGSTDSTADSGTGGTDAVGGSGSGSQSGTGGGQATGGSQATGGAQATGGNHAAGGTSTGGQESSLPEPWSPCNYTHPGLEPPCDESDVNGVLSLCGLFFDVPLAHVVPPALGLQVVLLPLEPGEGGDGMGGAGSAEAQPLVLEVISLFPDLPPWESGETFDVVDPAGFVRAGTSQSEGELSGYVTGPEEYGVAEVALRQGAETLSVHRGLYLRPAIDLCVK